MGVGGQRHAPAALTRERPGNHFMGDWVGPRTVRKISPLPGFDHKFHLSFLLTENFVVILSSGKCWYNSSHAIWLLPSIYSFNDTFYSHSWSGYCKCENQVDSVACAGKQNSLPPGITHTLHLSDLRDSKMTLGPLVQRHIYNEWYRL